MKLQFSFDSFQCDDLTQEEQSRLVNRFIQRIHILVQQQWDIKFCQIAFVFKFTESLNQVNTVYGLQQSLRLLNNEVFKYMNQQVEYAKKLTDGSLYLQQKKQLELKKKRSIEELITNGKIQSWSDTLTVNVSQINSKSNQRQQRTQKKGRKQIINSQLVILKLLSKKNQNREYKVIRENAKSGSDLQQQNQKGDDINIKKKNNNFITGKYRKKKKLKKSSLGQIQLPPSEHATMARQQFRKGPTRAPNLTNRVVKSSQISSRQTFLLNRTKNKIITSSKRNEEQELNIKKTAPSSQMTGRSNAMRLNYAFTCRLRQSRARFRPAYLEERYAKVKQSQGSQVEMRTADSSLHNRQTSSQRFIVQSINLVYEDENNNRPIHTRVDLQPFWIYSHQRVI